MSRFYIFELPKNIVDGLEPFKFNFPEDPQDAQEESQSSSDSDSGDESSASEQEDARSSSKPAKKSTFSSAVTKYADDEDDVSMEQWQWANRAHITGTPFVYFTNPGVIPEGKILSLYKSWFDPQQLIYSPVEEVRKLPSEGKSCILMVNSGNFAGAIFDHRKHHHKTNISNPFANVIVLESKTFHRYTTRRKQGGAQSASDSAHGKANSAGSTIRRANERALQEEIKELLNSWAPLLQHCHRIFIRAPGRSNRQLLTGYAGAPIGKSDPRVFQIPFATGRPTLNECKSAWIQLTQAQIVDSPSLPKTSPALASSQTSPAPSRAKTPDPEAVKPELTTDEKITSKVVDLIKRSKLPALKTVIENEADGNWDFPLQPTAKYFLYPCPLLYAAHFDKQNVVSQLLKWGASPLIKNEQGQALGDIAAPHKRTREALQITRKELGEDRWNWKLAKVGQPVTKDQLLQKDLQEKLRIQKEHEQLEAEQNKKEKEQRMERLISKHGSGKLTGGLYEASRGLSQQELVQVERERRARAAEARLARLSGR